jgi:hypothetical protein
MIRQIKVSDAEVKCPENALARNFSAAIATKCFPRA